MPDASARIPIPPSQRWENLRTRALPVLCLAATVLLCGLLWRRQSLQMPLAIGEVKAAWQDVRSPTDGQLLPVASFSDGTWPLFSEIKRGDIAARIKTGTQDVDVVEVTAPVSGVVTANHVQHDEQVSAGDPLLRIAASRAKYIVCHLPEELQQRVEPGQSASVRHREVGAAWLETVVESIGPQVEPIPPHQLPDALTPAWGLPILIQVPPALVLKPGSLVEVRFVQ